MRKGVHELVFKYTLSKKKKYSKKELQSTVLHRNVNKLKLKLILLTPSQ